MAGLLLPGDAAPWFHAPLIGGRPRFAFDSVAGRVVVLLFAGRMRDPAVEAALAMLAEERWLFDDDGACFFGITSDPDDDSSGRGAPRLPGLRWFLDADLAVARRYGAVAEDGSLRPHWLVLDAQLRVVGRAPLADGRAMLTLARRLAAERDALPPAPVIAVPNVLEPALCRQLIAWYEAHGGTDSGMMVEQAGKTVGKIDHGFKRRSDCLIEDEALQGQLRARIQRFLLPMVARAFQFQATRIERWLVACYDDRDGGGHFSPHRDNTTAGTAHRRFACTINLNADDYEGGDLVFPEFGRRRYRASTGGAVIFSCSLLHQVLPVTRGRRFAFLPFFYDEAAARIRAANRDRLAG